MWPPGFIDRCKPSIEFLELYSLTAGFLAWRHSPKMTNTRVNIFCDNESVVHMVNNMAASCIQSQKLIRIIALENIIFHRRVFILHIHSKDNCLSDTLSRGQFQRFWHLAPRNMEKFFTKMLEIIWPIDRFWRQKLSFTNKF